MMSSAKNTRQRKRATFSCEEKEIEVEGKLGIFFKCKGWQFTEVKLTIENKTDNKKVLEDKKIIIGDDANEEIRIGRYSDDVSL